MSRKDYLGLSDEERTALKRQKDNERSRRYRARHPDRRAATTKRWRQQNPEKAIAIKRRFNERHRDRLAAKARDDYWRNHEARKARARTYAREHREEKIAYSRTYRRQNPEKVTLQTREYRRRNRQWSSWVVRRYQLRKRNAPINDLTLDQWEAIKMAFGHRCAYCGEAPNALTQDHVVPLSRGGNHTVANVVPACQPCNSRKHNRLGWVPRIPAVIVHGRTK